MQNRLKKLRLEKRLTLADVQAKAKIEQSNSIPDYAKDPEVDQPIEQLLDV